MNSFKEFVGEATSPKQVQKQLSQIDNILIKTLNKLEGMYQDNKGADGVESVRSKDFENLVSKVSSAIDDINTVSKSI